MFLAGAKNKREPVFHPTKYVFSPIESRSRTLRQRHDYSNNTNEVWDLVPRNVLVDAEGDIFVVDAEIKLIEVSVSALTPCRLF